MSHYDLLIRNGEVFDGSGAASRRCDVAIRDGLIARIAPEIDADAARVIDARGQIVTPGFVDVHTHYDGQAAWDAQLRPSSSLGATTVVMGNCGVGFAPCRAQDREALVSLMEGVEEIPGSAMHEGLPWNWESFPEYLNALDARARDIDIAALLPHGPLRVYVMGERALRREPATAADIRQMQTLVADAVAAGAVGLSTSRTLAHRDAEGQFTPSYQAATAELKQLGAALSGEKGSVFQFISDWEDAESEFGVLTDIAEATGAKGTFTLLDTTGAAEAIGGVGGQAGQWRAQLERLEQAQARGLDIRGQVLSRPVGILMGLSASMHPFYRRPSFAACDELPMPQRLEQLRDPAVKARVLAETNINPHVFIELGGQLFEHMYRFEAPLNYFPEAKDAVSACAAHAGVSAESWLYDYLLEGDGDRLIFIPGSNFSPNIVELLRHPHTVVALGDGGAHVGSICDASAQVYLLTHWVRELQAIGLAEAIHLLSRQPAELYSLLDRGLLAEGMRADVNIIDFEALSLQPPHVAQDLPGGGRRFLQRAEGISATIKSGQLIYENGQATGAMPGRLLRGAQSDKAQRAA